MRSRLILFFLFLVLLPASIPAAAQNDCQFNPRRGCSANPIEEKMERDRAKAQNKDRQQALKRDTDKLFALATELKNYVDKTNENTLSLDVIKKAEEIEKLAKSVREKMKADNLLPGPESDPLMRPHR